MKHHICNLALYGALLLGGLACSSADDDASTGPGAGARTDTVSSADSGTTDGADGGSLGDVASEEDAVASEDVASAEDTSESPDLQEPNDAGTLDSDSPEDAVDERTDSAEPSIVTEDVTFDTTDGKTLAATVYRRTDVSASAPGVLLLHQYLQNRGFWAEYADDVAALGYVVLAVDFRGHGESSAQDGALSGVLTDPAQLPDDVQTSVAWLGGLEEVDADRLAVVGLSVGANMACVAMANDYGVKLAVAVSPRQSAVESLADTTDLSFDSLYCVATENDGSGAQADTCNAFEALSGDPSMTIIIPESGAHGAGLISSMADQWTAIVDYLAAEL